ncbi:c-type cytochrome [Burkholderia sp. ISTR5]|uniref:c-type cytochrome n=1 Tax=Burkholderia sp. ISTR5 TaxID=2500161 RepID=UPI00136D0581|nr:cytochrome c [Burkholderia sp. ISTR5]NBI50462.1 cytochrome c [Burkholderia sp. ISTR5]
MSLRRFLWLAAPALATLGMFVAALAVGLHRYPAGTISQPAGPDAALVARGAYLARLGDCAGCHTAPQGGAPYAGGLGLGSPFGSIVTTNITPDRRHGIGRYTLADFDRALRRGIAPGGKRLYPAMPYASFSKLGDDDVRALYAYLMLAVAPVARPAPPSDVAFPFNQRWALGLWQLGFVPVQAYVPRSDRDARWNRGAYLVQSLGHCGSCHTPRGPAYQELGYDERSPRWLTGGVNDHWFAPNLTGDPGAGLGRVDTTTLVEFLRTGHGGGLSAFGSMVAQVEDSSQYLSPDDAAAIAAYLKSLPARRPSGGFTPGGPSTAQRYGNRLSDALTQGAQVYRSACARCHGEDGAGAPPAFPRLAGNPAVIGEDTTSLIRLVVEGGNSPRTESGPPRAAMPGFASTLTDTQIAAALTWIRSAWGNDALPVTGNDVSSLREKLHK